MGGMAPCPSPGYAPGLRTVAKWYTDQETWSRYIRRSAFRLCSTLQTVAVLDSEVSWTANTTFQYSKYHVVDKVLHRVCSIENHLSIFFKLLRQKTDQFLTFYRAAWNADGTRSSGENSVCPSVRLSNACIVTKLKKNLSRFLCHTKKSFSLVFWEKEWLVGGNPFYLKCWVNRPPLVRNRWFWTDNCS